MRKRPLVYEFEYSVFPDGASWVAKFRLPIGHEGTITFDAPWMTEEQAAEAVGEVLCKAWSEGKLGPRSNG
jgi:hypothetical protein